MRLLHRTRRSSGRPASQSIHDHAMSRTIMSPAARGHRRRPGSAAATAATAAAAAALALLPIRCISILPAALAFRFPPPHPSSWTSGRAAAIPRACFQSGAGWRQLRQYSSTSGGNEEPKPLSSLPPSPAAPCSVPDCLAWATQAFAAANIPDPRLSAEYLLLHALGQPPSTPRSALASAPLRDTVVGAEALAALHRLCERRAMKREPVQYLVGTWDFHRISLQMTPPILIPRPETEELVEWVLESIPKSGGKEVHQQRGLRFLDVGCGTGAIGLALFKALPPSIAATSACIALDPHPTAAQLAQRNAAALGLNGERYQVVQGRIEEEATIETLLSSGGPFDFIVSNPPYIPQSDMAGLQAEVRAWEDPGALVGGKDGTDVIRAILAVSPRLLRSRAEGGLGKVWMEVDVSHPALFEQEEEGKGQLQAMRMVEWRRDMAGNPRFICWVD